MKLATVTPEPTDLEKLWLHVRGKRLLGAIQPDHSTFELVFDGESPSGSPYNLVTFWLRGPRKGIVEVGCVADPAWYADWPSPLEHDSIDWPSLLDDDELDSGSS